MIHFEGEKIFPLPVANVAAKLSDAGFLVQCLPDTQISEVGAERAVWKLKPKLSFLTGSLNVEMTRTAHEPGRTVAFEVLAKAMGAGSTVKTYLTFLEAEGGGTRVEWTGDLTEVTGLLKMVPKGLIQGSAESVIADVWTAVSERLNADSRTA